MKYDKPTAENILIRNGFKIKGNSILYNEGKKIGIRLWGCIDYLRNYHKMFLFEMIKGNKNRK